MLLFHKQQYKKYAALFNSTVNNAVEEGAGSGHFEHL
jgi:hypothetical protein